MNAVTEASTPHRPVLYQETIEYLAPKSSGRYIDCTAGAGGHSSGILEVSSLMVNSWLSIWILQLLD